MNYTELALHDNNNILHYNESRVSVAADSIFSLALPVIMKTYVCQHVTSWLQNHPVLQYRNFPYHWFRISYQIFGSTPFQVSNSIPPPFKGVQLTFPKILNSHRNNSYPDHWFRKVDQFLIRPDLDTKFDFFSFWRSSTDLAVKIKRHTGIEVFGSLISSIASKFEFSSDLYPKFKVHLWN